MFYYLFNLNNINFNKKMSDIRFTPILPRHNNNLYDQYVFSNNNHFNNQLNNNISNNNNFQFDQNNNFSFNGNNNIFSSCYILITRFDNCLKELLINFMEQQGITSRDIKIIGNDKIIIKFLNQYNRDDFINAYEKVKDNFYGVVIQFIDENEKDRIVNNNANRILRNITYSHNYMNNNNMIQLPQNKTNFQKFLDVFLNL